jgi:hypothetical protein
MLGQRLPSRQPSVYVATIAAANMSADGHAGIITRGMARIAAWARPEHSVECFSGQ